jgi:hypothetical protein
LNVKTLKRLNVLVLLCVFAFLAACSKPSAATPVPTSLPVDLLSLLPKDDALTGWEPLTDAATYNRENLYNLVDGQADAFFAYGFEQVATRRYQNADGVFVNVEIWQLATPADAYGLFHVGRAGQPAKIGAEGDTDPGRRLAFWQDRYFASVSASGSVPDEMLWSIANGIISKLPAGADVPGIVTHLPAENMTDGSLLFFHEEISIQNEVWLGGENVLGLSQQTNGALARYELGGMAARLLVIEYSTPTQAADALKALQAGNVSDLLASQVNGHDLAAVFGKADVSQAQKLVEQALK